MRSSTLSSCKKNGKHWCTPYELHKYEAKTSTVSEAKSVHRTKHKITVGISERAVCSATRNTCCTVFFLVTISRLGAGKHSVMTASMFLPSCLKERKCKAVKLWILVRMWDMSVCLYSREPCGFSPFLCVAAVTHVTLRDVLHEVCNATSGTKRRDSCISSLLMSNAPTSAQKSMATNEPWVGHWIEVQSTAIVTFTEHTSAVHAPHRDNLGGNVTRLSCVRSHFVSTVKKTLCG